MESRVECNEGKKIANLDACLIQSMEKKGSEKVRKFAKHSFDLARSQ